MVNHGILLKGVGPDGTLTQDPVLSGMADTDFADRFFRDFGLPDGQRIGSAQVIATSWNATARLLQPVQRMLHAASVTLACDTIGTPRLDPLRIESMGLVVRRVSRPDGVNDDAAAPPEGWMKTAEGRFGWVRLTGAQPDYDPDPARRPQLRSGQPELDQMLSGHLLLTAMQESYSPVFLAPPEVCERTGKSIAYGVVPTASSDVSDDKPLLPDYSGVALADQLPPLLLAGDHRVPLAEYTVDYRYTSEEYLASRGYTQFLTFVNVLRVTANELGAFDNTPEATRLMTILNNHNVGFAKTTQPLGDFLHDAADALLLYDPASSSPPPQLAMPKTWDSFTAADQDDLVQAAAAALRARSQRVLAPEGRFQDPTRRYRLRLFFRIRGHDAACPPQLLWSDYSEVFRIAPWYASAARIGPPIPLPNPSRAFLKNLKPNVAFVVPGSLMNAMPSMSNLGDGSASPMGKGIDIAWVCSFSIPIITICAFFVLNIFLQLLNIVFFWMFFVKICIPIPVPAALAGGDE